MTRFVSLLAVGLLVALTGCTKVVFDSENGGARQLLQLARPGNSITTITGPEAMQPDVSFDRNRVAFVRTVGTPPVRQVFVMTIGDAGSLQQVTSDPVDKSYPRWSTQGQLAFRAGSDLRVLNPDFTPFDLGTPTPQADGGLDFYDNGNGLVYQRNGNLYVLPVDRSVPETPITNCPPPNTRCGSPVVSHDQTKLAYRRTVMLAAGYPEVIHVILTGSWSNLGSFMMGPALGGSGKVHSFDFARSDNKLYVAAKSYDAATGSYGNDLLLFEVNLDGSDKSQLAPGPQVRYPSAR
ncbi:MAG: hypothetical protein JSU82_07465 [Rhodospirillales bacterium]|nr:MAG: hypothetical protein JSU82_07465 [Rhodospirillales bacterium]